MEVLESVSLWLLLILLASLTAVSKRFVWTKSILLTLLLACLASWWFINRLSGDGINPATVYHLKTGLAGAGIRDFAPSIAGLVVLYALSVLPLLIPILTRSRKTEGGVLIFAVYLLCFALCVAAGPLYRDAVRLAGYFSDVSTAAISVEYRIPAPVANRKNILWVYAEGLEQTYFDRSLFPDLLPGLRRLSRESLEFRNVSSLPGSEWTIAGIVSSMCGMPLTAWHGDDVNSLERIDRFLPGAYCLSDHLKSEGYYLEFIGGAPQEFAGKGKFLAAHGFERIKDDRFFVRSGVAPADFASWGVHDDVLLDTVYERFMELSEAGEPFFLTALTVDTHHPSGAIPRTCADLRHATEQPMLDAIKCTDRLLSRLIQKVRASRYADNTIIVLSSDHIALPNEVMETLESAKSRRNLVYIFDSEQTPRVVEREGSTYDTGATLLDLMGAGPAIGFGRSMLREETDGATSAFKDGRDVAPYFTFSRSLWLLESGRTVRLKGTALDLGAQSVDLPVSFAIARDGTLAGIFLASGDRREVSLQTPRIGRVDRCIAFTRQLNGSDWCLLLTDGAGRSRVYGASRLRSGIDLAHPGEPEPVDIRLTTSFIVQQPFSTKFQFVQDGGSIAGGAIRSSGRPGLLMAGPYVPLEAGTYRVTVLGEVESPSSDTWADVTSGLGTQLHVRAPLKPSDAAKGIIFQRDITLEKDAPDVEIRVNAGGSDTVRVDAYSVLPTTVTP